MYMILPVIFSILMLNIIQIESYKCSCSCCFGQGCQASTLSDLVDAQQCTDASCLEACKARYYQCNVSPPNGQAIGRCLSTTTMTTTNSPSIGGQFSCRCNCCNTGSYSCTTSFVGTTNAFTCDTGACSIACAKQYPQVCVNNQYGRTEGTCVGIIPNGTKRCGCFCLALNGGYHNYEVTTNDCSLCTNACQSIQLQCYNYQSVYCTE